MIIGYDSERLHHALHPLFLTINPDSRWVGGADDGKTDWYFADTGQGFVIRQGNNIRKPETDLYAVKREIYDYFYRQENIRLPWGIISGIRPAKLARKIREREKIETFSDFQHKLWEIDRISPDKAGLLWEVLQTEDRYLQEHGSAAGQHLYIGIPFCPSRCYYCSFAAGVVRTGDDRLGQYVRLLGRELAELKELWQEKPLRTVYIGGGTPTVLSEDLLRELLTVLAETVSLNTLAEFTVEAGRPDTISPEKLDILREFGVHRISINPQSFSDRTLAVIGRSHTVAEVFRAYEAAKERGFAVNMDLIFGLEGETLVDVENSFMQMEKLRPDNITVHTLTPKRGADLSLRQKQVIWQGGQGIGAMLDQWRTYMRQGGWQPYYLYRQKNIYFENVGYSLPGTECIYNMETMLERQSVIAIGAGSISKRVEADKIWRYDMPKEWQAYRESLAERVLQKRRFFLE